MHYEAQLQFLLGVLQKCSIPASTVQDPGVPSPQNDLGLRLLNDPDVSVDQVFGSINTATVYSFADRLGCRYIYFRLPETSKAIQIIGPYATEQLSQNAVLALSEQLQFSPREAADLRHYLSTVPLLADDSPLHYMLEQLYETMWGAGGYTFSNASPKQDLTIIPHKDLPYNDSLWNARILEQRYAGENTLMEAVARGQLHKVERSFPNFSPDLLEERTSDTLRNTKNYCIILNTLLRKAAEQGGVHPCYIDRISTDYAIRIENLPNISNSAALMREMTKSYCMLVQYQKTANYAPLVQRTILLIDEDLSADLSLRGLAEKLNVSGSYLSTLFKKETSKTVTEFITERRINLAKHLLKNTALQIQTIAQHCGFPDVNYFSKTFKKATGLTPKACRAEQ